MNNKKYLIPMSKINESEFIEEEVEVEVVETKDFVTAKKEGYRDKGFYKQYFEWLLYTKYIKESC